MPPLLAGSMNHWQYTPMIKIEDLVAALDSEHVDILQHMASEERINEG